jgi:ATP-dependent Clp protease ATP-binding subunit ClpA
LRKRLRRCLPAGRRKRKARRPSRSSRSSSTRPATIWNGHSARAISVKAGELAYGVIPDLEKAIAEAEGQDQGGDMVEEAVTTDHIAHIVSRWTGIPVDKMLEGEREKLSAHGRRDRASG